MPRPVLMQDCLRRCEAVAANPGAEISAWKERNPDGPVIGYFPVYVPPELIQAVGGLPVGIWGGPTEISGANAYIQQFVCSIVRSATEYALSGVFDVLDAMVFPPTCDSAKLVSSIWLRNFGDRFYIDMLTTPERIDSRSSPHYLEAEMRRLIGQIEQRTGTKASPEKLAAAIGTGNAIRALQDEMYALRCGRLGFHEVYAVMKAGTCLHPEDYLPMLRELVAALRGQMDDGAVEGIPVAITGLACQMPHRSLFRHFDDAGLTVVNDDLFLGLRSVGQLDPAADPIEALASAFVDGVPLATRHHFGKSRLEYIIGGMRRSRARAMIFLIPKFCEPELFDLRHLRDGLNAARIPNITIEFEEDAVQAGGIQTRLEAFAESLWQQNSRQSGA